MDAQTLWKKTLAKIKEEVSTSNFHGWFSKTLPVTLKENNMQIAVPSAFVGDQLKLRFLSLIENALTVTAGENIKLECLVEPVKFSKQTEENFALSFPTLNSHPNHQTLNPKFTLSNFVVGPTNNVAYAAAEAVVANPGSSYNPLLIYGGTGVGKTHLMLGIGNAILSKNPHLKIIYCASEQFTNDYVSAIQTNRRGDLRSKYRSCDLLLIDDIQFFSGREGTQEEFFHTFNELQSKNSQMVLTSDRPPGEIVKLEDRLKSRFQGGLMVDIQSPDFDTRMAILQAKCSEHGEVLAKEVLDLLATSWDTNIREMEGRLVGILQHLKSQALPATLENVAKLVNQKSTPIQIDPKKVLNSVSDFFTVPVKDLTGPKRQKELVLPRQIVMYLLAEELNLTVAKTGELLGGRDHTTVMHGRDKIKELIIKDREVQKLVIEVKNKLSTQN